MMKDILVVLLGIALFSFVVTNDFRISLKPLRFEIETFNWGLTIGLFFIIFGVFISTGYARHLGKKDSGYFEGYKEAVKDCVELLDKSKTTKKYDSYEEI